MDAGILMPRDGAITFGDLIGKLDVVRVECAKCGRGLSGGNDLISRSSMGSQGVNREGLLNDERTFGEYREKVRDTITSFGGQFIVRGGNLKNLGR